MSDMILYMAPGTCARVTAIALEELGLSFETRLVRFTKGEHKSAEFKTHNPKGKVPALIYEGETLTENVAIISYLNERHGKLLPVAKDALDRARQLADLCFCAATLHPIVTRIRMPVVFTEKEQARLVWEKGRQAMDEYFQLIEDRLQTHSWWYGDQWSAMDGYLFWVFWRVQGANYDVSRFPYFCDHARRMQQRPAVQRAIAREDEAQKILQSEGLVFVPPTFND